MDSERENIQHRILVLRKRRDIELSHGDPEVANQLLNEIADLERKTQNLKERNEP